MAKHPAKKASQQPPLSPKNSSPDKNCHTEIANTLGNLEISTSHPQKTAQKPKSKPVADSWDLDDDGSDTETEQVTTLKNKADSPHEALEPISTTDSRDLPPNPPPPTPASPTQFEYPDTIAPYSLSSEGPRSRGVGGGSLDKRPEKTTAVAGRLIAGALGVRAPKRTDEEREYDRVMREKERKRRAEEKEKEKRETEAREARKKAVWDD
ncbi:ubiquitin smt3 [Pyrenophora seminiperda CCB06]|uniref:Ubiquitin smt3 n=1 Tax=Pyrenophora seminiperda CCB06 TaxID=1302712 RepID=A0A3M7MDT3_9PLEO|nr:ubiquitin smt3 [Pyrenophora seminiperda CCB06]